MTTNESLDQSVAWLAARGDLYFCIQYEIIIINHMEKDFRSFNSKGMKMWDVCVSRSAQGFYGSLLAEETDDKTQSNRTKPNMKYNFSLDNSNLGIYKLKQHLQTEELGKANLPCLSHQC